MSLYLTLFDTLSGLLVMAIILRFLFQLVQADFYNPLCQLVVKVTDPVLQPCRKLLPTTGRYDMAALLMACVVQALFILLKMEMTGVVLPHAAVASLTVYMVIKAILDLYTFALFILVIASWVAPGSYNPGLSLLHQLTEPLCSRVRKVLPPMGGLDFSVMVVMLSIFFIKGALPALLHIG